MFARPKPGDDEDAILKQQEEFLKSKAKPAASVANKRRAENEKSSIFARSRDAKKSEKRICQPIETSILGDIKEKTLQGYNNWKFNPPSISEGFPEVFAGHQLVSKGSSSIFAQSFKQKNDPNEAFQMESNSIVDTTNKLVGDRSFILSGSEASEIHKENVEKLSKLSSDEILAEQQKLKDQLDPKLLEFLLSRRKICVSRDSSENSLTMDCDMPSCSNVEAVNPNLVHVKEEPCPKGELVNENLKSVGISKEEASRWLHMDVVEEEKIVWIGDIPAAEPVPSSSPYSARFDFEGMLMPHSPENVDVREGLYNHGEDPGRPGYTIEELYQLSRSTFKQQRIIAINAIANILEKTRMGYYDECLSVGLLECLLDQEVFLLLRFALDDNSDAQVSATLKALKNLLSSRVDEVCLDRAMGCSRSIWQPSLAVRHDIRASEEQELKNTEAELKDYQMLKLDVIKGALRTDIIIRLRYILEIVKPNPKTVILALEILTRFARHSHDTALALTCCPRLVQFIIMEFVPYNWKAREIGVKPSEMLSVYGMPLVEALKLLRVIACQSRSFASDLVHKYGIMKSIINYISLDPRDGYLPYQEVLRLSLESLYIWQTLLAYNLATQEFVDVFPIMMRLQQFHACATSTDDAASSFSQEHGAALVALIEQAVHTAHFQDTLSVRTASRTLGYHHVKDFMYLVETCLSKWLTQLGSIEDVMFPSMKLTGAALNCLAAFYSCHFNQPDVDTVAWLDSVEEYAKSRVLPFLLSSGFRLATAQLQQSSCLLYEGEVGTKRDPSQLPSLGCVMWKARCVTPVLQPKSPIPLLHGLANFLLVAYNIHKGLSSEYAQALLSDPSLLEYVSRVATGASAVLGSHWFTRLEVNMLVSVLRLTHLTRCQYSSVFHNLAFRLATLIQKDEKFVLKEVMSKIIFSADFLKQSSLLAQTMAEMSLKESCLLSGTTSKLKLVMEAVDEIPALWSTYEELLGLKNSSPKSMAERISFTATERGTELILPVDWTYLPIIHLHSQDKSAQMSSKESISMVVRALKWTLLVEWLRPTATASVSATDRFCRLATVFLSGSDMFLDTRVHTLLAAGLATLMNDNHKIKFPASFYDLYTQLLEQFAAVSYGDSLFGHFLLVPLQQRHSPNLRKQVWSEHAAILRILSTPLNQLMFPLEEMLEPCESESSLLWAYLHNLATGGVKESWSPVLYWVAVHHVATFIQIHQDTGLAQQIRAKILKLANQELQMLLLNYKGPPHLT